MKDIGAGLHNVGEQYMRHLLGNRVYNNAGVAVHGANFENILTALPVDYSVKGVMYTAAAKAEIDISTLAGLPSVALPDAETQYFGFELDTADNVYAVYGETRPNAALADGSQVADWPVASGPDRTLFAVLAIDNSTAADFVLGTTLLTVAGLTVSYFNIAISGLN